MAKKSSKLSSNFFINSSFIYENKYVNCSLQTIINESGKKYNFIFEPSESSNNTIKFAYQANAGLVRVNSNNGSIEETNILGDFTKIVKIVNKDKKANAYLNFFNKNGFLFNVTEQRLYSMDDLDLYANRINETIHLQALLNSNKKNRNLDIIDTIKFLLETDVQNKNQFNKLLSTASNVVYKNNSIYDDVYMKYNVLNSDLIIDLMSKSRDFDLLTEDSFFNQVFTAYISPRDKKYNDWYKLVSFFVHYYINMFNKNENPIDEKMVDALIIGAKYLYKEEIDFYISDIRPCYDIQKEGPSWHMNSLLSCLYLSIFYLNTKLQIYKECEYCGKLFLVKATSFNRKYCSDACANNANAARFRARKKESMTIH